MQSRAAKNNCGIAVSEVLHSPHAASRWRLAPWQHIPAPSITCRMTLPLRANAPKSIVGCQNPGGKFWQPTTKHGKNLSIQPKLDQPHDGNYACALTR